MNQYPLWKNALVVIVAVASIIIALPNFYGEDPAVQVSLLSEMPVGEPLAEQIARELENDALERAENHILVRFAETEAQLRAVDVLQATLGDEVTVALNLAPRMPGWMQSLGLRPMNLGLDLRGGVHFLLEVDMEAAIEQALERYESDVRAFLREESIRYSAVTVDRQRIRATLRDAADLDRAVRGLRRELPGLDVQAATESGQPVIELVVSEQRMREIR